MVQKKVNEIILKKELYPREKINESKVEEYKQYITVLPKIIINQDNILIDGAHRLHANKRMNQEFIECDVMETKDDDDLFLKAVELNAKHGYQMTQKEKKDSVISLYEKTLNGEAKSFDVKRLKESFGIPDTTFSDWTKKLSQEIEAKLLEKILNLYLQNHTQEEIGKKVGLARNTVTDKIKEIDDFLKGMSENPISEIPTKFKFLADIYTKMSEFSPQLYNIWNKQAYDSDNQHFGKFPFTFMENLIYYYTKPFDVVFDPFAGGGTTIDVCKKWLRKYCVSDLNPIETRDDIPKHDIMKGLPEHIPSKINFVFLDPPYWRQAEGEYSKDKEDLGNMELDNFYESIEFIAKELKKKMKEGYVAFVIQPTQWKNNKVFEDHIFKIINMFEKNGFKEDMRYVLPYSTQQYNAQMVEITKKEKLCLNLIRDLVVFKKC
jgi:DNA modification methylase